MTGLFQAGFDQFETAKGWAGSNEVGKYRQYFLPTFKI